MLLSITPVTVTLITEVTGWHQACTKMCVCACEGLCM